MSSRNHVELRRDCVEGRLGRSRGLEIRQRIPGARLSVCEATGNKISESPYAMDLSHCKAGRDDQRNDLVRREPARQRIVLTKAAIGIAQRGPRLIETTRQCPTEHGGISVRDKHARRASRTKAARDRRQHRRWIVHVFQDAVAKHNIGAVRSEQLDKIAAIGLCIADEIRNAGVGNPPRERRERICARVDDGHVMTELRDRDREPASAAANIDDVEGASTGGRSPRFEDCTKRLPDGTGPGRAVVAHRVV